MNPKFLYLIRCFLIKNNNEKIPEIQWINVPLN